MASRRSVGLAWLWMAVAVAASFGWSYLAGAQERTDRIAFAQRLLDEARFDNAAFELQALHSSMGSDADSSRLSDLIRGLRTADQQLREQRFARARSTLEALTASHPEQAMPHYLLHFAHLGQGREADAKQALERARELAPDSRLLQQQEAP